MPLYEYECQSCATRFERIRKFSDPPLEVCPTCGGKITKLISSPAIQFKGSGFYQTDYRSDSYKKAAKADSAAGKSADSSSKESSGKSGESSSSGSNGASCSGDASSCKKCND